MTSTVRGTPDLVDVPLPQPDFARVFDQAPAPFLLLTPDLVIVRANQARLEATATTHGDIVGRHLFDVFPLNPDDPAADGLRNLRESLERARDTRRPQTMPVQKYDIRMPDGTYEERFWSPRNVPILDDSGRVVLLLHRSDDITDYVQDREAARGEVADPLGLRERVQQVEADLYARARELEQVNAELVRTGERERRTARALAGLAATVSALASADTLDELLEQLFRHGSSALQTDTIAVALHAPGAAHLDVVHSIGGRPVPPDTGGREQVPGGSPRPIARAARGERIFVPQADVEPGVHPRVPAPEAFDVQAWAALPLPGPTGPIGSFALAWRRPREFGEDDVRLFEAFAAQCAQAVRRVVRLESEREHALAARALAEALQRSLLTQPPQPDSLEITARYRPAAGQAQVGGDWYDAFLSRDGATTLVVGDVAGHDQVAAAAMGQLRNLLRGIAHVSGGSPAAVLDALDLAVRDLGTGTLATAVLARVEQDERPAASGLRELRWSSAGHPPLLLVHPDGEAALLDRSADLLLGVAPGTERSDHVVTLLPGATVVAYTDGLVERRGEPLDVGLQRLTDVARALAPRPLDAFTDGLIDRLAPDAEDDVALIALRAHPEGSRP